MEATVGQRLLLIDIARRGEEHQREWIQSNGTRPRSQSGVREIIEVEYQRYVIVPPSQTEVKNECLEAGWIEPWRDGPAKYALTPLGFAQIADEA
jgi:hypothetical protein